jgi:hypothetical protein
MLVAVLIGGGRTLVDRWRAPPRALFRAFSVREPRSDSLDKLAVVLIVAVSVTLILDIACFDRFAIDQALELTLVNLSRCFRSSSAMSSVKRRAAFSSVVRRTIARYFLIFISSSTRSFFWSMAGDSKHHFI